MRKKIAFPLKKRKTQTIKRQLKNSERRPCSAWPRKKKSSESAGGSAKKSRRSGGDAFEFLKEKAESEYSIRRQELELQRKEQEARSRQQEVQLELLRKQAEQQVQISQALMTMMQNLVKSP